MKKYILFFLPAFFAGILQIHAQTVNPVRAQIVMPQGTQFSREVENQLQIQVLGLNGSQEYLRMKTTDINTIPGIIAFNMILNDDNINGYCDLRFSASSKNEAETMLREIFCRMDIQQILINDTPFENCRNVMLP